jgi:UDP-N-acetylmuramoyl-tripeptide--D-alanyl-D-alanine ligase
MMNAILIGSYVAAVAVASLRWLRVAQREHYAPGRTVLFAVRWWWSSPVNRVLAVAAAVAAVAAVILRSDVAFLLAAGTLLVTVIGPVGLPLRGGTAALRWTRRLKVVAAFAGVLVAALAVIAAFTTVWVLPAFAVLHPVVMDLALLLDGPVERTISGRYVKEATARLRRVSPTVIGITGSYGKTTVKNYTAHLLGRSRKTLASRKSFNNLLGLTLSVNSDLEPGTEFFVAEMGTYGPGEIAKLCDWLEPRISAMIAIGPMHLERMGSLDNIAKAKSEILTTAETAVLNVDDERLRPLADDFAAKGGRVVRCSTVDADADVAVLRTGEHLELRIDGASSTVPIPPVELVDINLAIALGLCLAAGSVPPDIEAAVATLPSVANRMVTTVVDGGPTIIDDTYNSNPAGAAFALQRLDELATGTGGQRIVVTPGMVELGHQQDEANAEVARQVAEVGARFVVVGRTNRRALVAGYRSVTGTDPVTVPDRSAAVEWVRANAGAGDVVLYENDLPDHFP